MMGVEMTDIEYSTERVSGKHEKIPITSGDDNYTYYQSAVPYDITFSLHVVTDYLSEMDQITEQILPFFNPFVETQITLDGIDFSWDMKVIFEGAAIDQASDIEMDGVRSIVWIYNFRLKLIY